MIKKKVVSRSFKKAWKSHKNSSLSDFGIFIFIKQEYRTLTR